MAASYKDLRVANIYAPAGTSKKAEREHFYTAELPGILRYTPGTLRIGGEFNCTQQPHESTSAPNPSGALAELLRRLALTDPWAPTGAQPAYTQYTNTGASRHIAHRSLRQVQENRHAATPTFRLPGRRENMVMDKSKLALIMRIDPKYIPEDFSLRPSFAVWPPQRQAAIVWIVAYFVAYQLTWSNRHTVLDYTAYVRRAQFRLLQSMQNHNSGKYLDLL
jgi:hypothetical protein